jgi:glutamate--cysteine ligase
LVDNTKIGFADCYDFLAENTFKIQSKDYGIKHPNWPGACGLELEMMPLALKGDALSPVAIYRSRNEAGDNPLSSSDILMSLAKEHNWQIVSSQTGVVDHFEHPDARITFEPGGQIEVSSQPFPCLQEAISASRNVQNQIRSAFAEEGIEMLFMGTNPWQTVEQIGLKLKRPRYQAMDKYYKQIGPYGAQMMRQTASIQVNLDFGKDETTLVNRYLASQLLAPFATATFAYSPMLNGSLTDHLSNRAHIWRLTDPSHTGLIGVEELAHCQSRNQCIDLYLKAVLSANVVFVAQGNAQAHYVPPNPITFGRWLEQPIKGQSPNISDFSTHLSLMFPEVRPRGFLEIRGIDRQAEVFQDVPAMYYSGLLYDEKSLMQVIETLLPFSKKVDKILVQASKGLSAEYLKVMKKIMEIACTGFEALPDCFKNQSQKNPLYLFKEIFTDQDKSPANDVVEFVRKNQGLTFRALRELEDRWLGLLL